MTERSIDWLNEIIFIEKTAWKMDFSIFLNHFFLPFQSAYASSLWTAVHAIKFRLLTTSSILLMKITVASPFKRASFFIRIFLPTKKTIAFSFSSPFSGVLLKSLSKSPREVLNFPLLDGKFFGLFHKNRATVSLLSRHSFLRHSFLF